MTAFDAIHVSASDISDTSDSLNWHADALVLKYSPDQAAYAEKKWAEQGFTTRLRNRLADKLSANGAPTKVEGDFLGLLCGAPEDGHAYACGNLLVTVGLSRITSLIIGSGGQALSHSAALTGVGDTSTAATIADTQLGSNSTTHSRYIVADTSNPSSSSGVISNQSTFGTGDGNFTWAEWGWVAAASAANSDTFSSSGTSPVLLNHKISSLGTKVSGASWVFQTSVTLS